MQISVSNVIFVGLGIVALVAMFVYTSNIRSEKPNILVIQIDTVRADHLGVYGYDKETSPFLDSLFRRGTVFTNAFAPAYLTFQTDAAIMSGLYLSQNGVRTWTTPVRDDVPLVQEIFKLHGYETHAFVWTGLREYFGLTRGYDTYTRAPLKDNFASSSPKVLETLKGATKPAFITWTIYDVHVPMLPADPQFVTEPYDGPFATVRAFDWTGQSTSTIRYREGNTWRTYEKTEASRRYVEAQYDSGIRRVDDGLKAFFAEAKKQGLLKNTIVVITAEHGEELGERGFYFHRDIYNTGVHVPLVIILPHGWGRVVDTPVTLIDLAPTLTELAGIPRFEAGEGVSLVPALSGEHLPERTIYIEREPFNEFAVVEWPYKLIVRDAVRGMYGVSSDDANDFFRSLRKNDVSLSDELYNIETDPEERTNLIGTGLPVEEVLRAKAKRERERIQTSHPNIDPANIPFPEATFTYP